MLHEPDITDEFTVIGITPDSDMDKIARAEAVTDIYESGRVLHPEPAPAWLFDYEAELFTFPASHFKDQVDATSQALRWMKKKGRTGRYAVGGRLESPAPEPMRFPNDELDWTGYPTGWH